ncbi:MAG: hypothetical protein J6035_01645 [Bacteroidaceae bacterium]|nr:hypothetical protein [Bacteroidaceae bacterium]
MDSVSALSYYYNLITTYVTYFWTYYRDLFRDYPYEVKTAIWVILWSLFLIIVIFVRLEHIGYKRTKRDELRKKLEGRFGRLLDSIFACDVYNPMSREDIKNAIDIDPERLAKYGYLRNDEQRRMVCRMAYERLMRDEVAGPSRTKNLQLFLNVLGLQNFLEKEITRGSTWRKMKAMTQARAFKLYMNPWLLNRLMTSPKVRLRRVAMYMSVMSSSDSELAYFETDFFDKNSCIYDEIELGYILNRRRNAGMKLPNLAHWAELQKKDYTKCMFVRLMRRFDQREYCAQLEPMFRESKHKKLIEEIARTWGYLSYTEGEQLLVEALLTQPDDTKVAILHAITRMDTGKNQRVIVDTYRYNRNPHVRYEALRCLWNYSDDGKEMIEVLEQRAHPEDKKLFAFFRNPLTLSRMPLNKEQAYHPSVETVYNIAN